MKTLDGHSILIFEPDLDAALALQDALASDGARVFTAYGADRAIRHAETTQLSAVIVGKTLSVEDRNTFSRCLHSRQIPVLQHDAVEGRHTDLVRPPWDIAARVAAAVLGPFGPTRSQGSYLNC
jgi:DNA-binding NtrC family response regulator